MGKKKEKNSEPRLVQHREIFQRMNFLYQAATLMTTITARVPQQKSTQAQEASATNVTDLNNTKNLASLGRFYVNTMKTIGTKQVLRIDPSIKRTLCKRCETILLPGITSKVRFKSRPESHLQVMCTECKTLKKYSARKGYQLFSEKPENIFGSNELSINEDDIQKQKKK